MRISIAIATCNGQRYLMEQLESFDKQALRPDEIVVSDDDSDDRTLDLVSRFKSKTNIRIVINKNRSRLGYSKNFQAALQLTTGDLVFLSDQDDVWFPNKISTIVQCAREHPDKNLFINEVMLTDRDLKPTGFTKLALLQRDGLGILEHGMGCATAVRRRLLDLLLPFPEGLHGHDNWINTFAEILDSRYYQPEVLQFYRRHGSATSGIQSNSVSVSFIRRVSSLLSSKKMNSFISGCKQRHAQEKLVIKTLENNIESFKKIGNVDSIDKCFVEYKFREFVRAHGKSSLFSFFAYLIFSVYFNRFHNKSAIFGNASLTSVLKDFTAFYATRYEQ